LDVYSATTPHKSYPRPGSGTTVLAACFAAFVLAACLGKDIVDTDANGTKHGSDSLFLVEKDSTAANPVGNDSALGNPTDSSFVPSDTVLAHDSSFTGGEITDTATGLSGMEWSNLEWVVASPTQAVSRNQTLLDVVWNGDQFVAVGTKGAVLTSSDGDTWTARSSGTTATLHSIVWINPGGSAGLFVAVGDSGTILTSPDAVVWTPRASNQSGVTFLDIAWNGTTAVLVGTQEQCVGAGCRVTQPLTKTACCVATYYYPTRIFSSGDGINWIERVSDYSLTTSGSIRSIVWGEASATGGGHFLTSVVGKNVGRSSDGQAWTWQEPSGSGLWLVTALVWGTIGGNPAWMAVGAQSSSSASGGLVSVSADGILWEPKAYLGAKLNAIIPVGSHYVVAANNGNLYVSDSTASNWTYKGTGTSSHLYGVAFDGSRIVAVGALGTIIRSH
jgi:hypothetical protein